MLVEAGLSGSPSNATPGLSQHGQAKAFDFVVSRGRDVVAGTVTATIQEKWEDAGWTAKLKQAVQDAGGKFVGPLPAPYEPWHYIYKAAAATAEARTGTGSTFSTDMCGTSLRRHSTHARESRRDPPDRPPGSPGCAARAPRHRSIPQHPGRPARSGEIP